MPTEALSIISSLVAGLALIVLAANYLVSGD